MMSPVLVRPLDSSVPGGRSPAHLVPLPDAGLLDELPDVRMTVRGALCSSIDPHARGARRGTRRPPRRTSAESEGPSTGATNALLVASGSSTQWSTLARTAALSERCAAGLVLGCGQSGPLAAALEAVEYRAEDRIPRRAAGPEMARFDRWNDRPCERDRNRSGALPTRSCPEFRQPVRGALDVRIPQGPP